MTLTMQRRFCRNRRRRGVGRGVVDAFDEDVFDEVAAGTSGIR